MIRDRETNYLEFSHELKNYLSDFQTKSNLIEMLVRPVNYLYKNHFPYFESRRKVDWTIEEEELLREIFRESDELPRFYLLALLFPGRSGIQIRMHFYKLLKKGEIEDPREKMPVKKGTYFKSFFRRIFLLSGEKALADTLVNISTSGVQVGKKLIIEKAEMTFRLPWVLAERVTYQTFFLNKQTIFDEFGEYTKEFID